MRYIIIPLLILLYIYWSYKSIKNIRKENKSNIELSNDEIFSTVVWFIVTIIPIGAFIIIFCIKYW